jgi:hypothetical protein
MIRWIASIICRVSGCPSDQRRARLRSMALYVGRAMPAHASDDDLMHAVLGAFRAMEDRAWRAEERGDKAEAMLREILSLSLGAAVPADMSVNPDAVLRQFLRSTAARRARG